MVSVLYKLLNPFPLSFNDATNVGRFLFIFSPPFFLSAGLSAGLSADLSAGLSAGSSAGLSAGSLDECTILVPL